jgi:D-glycero-D-manno-heptose 1,7-bisphosphate phosphatase
LTELKGEIIARTPDILLPSESLWGPSAARREGVALAPGASSPVKAWPVDRFAALAERIASDFKIPVRIILGERDAPLAEAFTHLPSKTVSLCLQRPLAEVAAFIAQSRLMITNDSGLMHLSSATGTPTAALFGPTHEQLGFYPLGLHDTVISVDETCRPCSLHGNKPCYREQQYCFTHLTVDEVYGRIAPLLERITLRPAAFIDRDGTLIEDKHYLADPDKIAFLPGALEAVRRLKEAGYLIVIVSNQSGVARGFFPVATVDRVHQRLTELMAAAGCAPDQIRFCPHLPDGDDPAYRGDCDCRKPKPGMLEQAARDLRVDMKRSYIIGDTYSDIQCGRAAATAALLVRTGEGRETQKNLPSHPYLRPDMVADELGAAAEFIVSRV